MKIIKLELFSLIMILFMTGIMACNAEKEVTERRNLMIPKKSELPRNSRYKENEKRKTYQPNQKKKKNKRLY